jgi:hypothetical protein
MMTFTSFNGLSEDYPLSACEMKQELEQILGSSVFNQAHRMCRLLRYLIEQTQLESKQTLSEYAIGLDVFDRNPSNYYPRDDPVVRVQMGRLRKRLASYYARLKEAPKLHISIPVGRYQPIIQRRLVQSCHEVNQKELAMTTQVSTQLSILPLYYISDDLVGRILTRRINEHLIEHAASVFGATLKLFSDLQYCRSAFTRLEGSAQIEKDQLVLTTRLVDQGSDAILFTKQFSVISNAGASLQIALVQAMCEQVRWVLDALGSHFQSV